MKFPLAPIEGRKYVKGKDLKEGDAVWFRSSGRHHDLFGTMLNGKILISALPFIPEYLHGKNWGLWPEHKYLLSK